MGGNLADGVWDMVQAGVVVLLDVRDLTARGNVTIDQLSTLAGSFHASHPMVADGAGAHGGLMHGGGTEPRTTLQSQQSYSHFGQYLTFGDLKYSPRQSALTMHARAAGQVH
jgi:hypothetical protein